MRTSQTSQQGYSFQIRLAISKAKVNGLMFDSPHFVGQTPNREAGLHILMLNPPRLCWQTNCILVG